MTTERAVYYQVLVVDQVNEGREVWALHSDWTESDVSAHEEAAEVARVKGVRTRVERLTCEILAYYTEGEREPEGARSS